MTVCAISLRQLDTRPVDHSTAPKAEVAHIAYVSQTPTTNSFFPRQLSMTSTHIGGNAYKAASTLERELRPEARIMMGREPLDLSNSTAKNVRTEISPFAIQDVSSEFKNTEFGPTRTHTLSGGICGTWEEGCAIQRRATARRWIATITKNQAFNATDRCVRSESFLTSSCPAMPFYGVADAFPPRSPGGRRFARGFFPSRIREWNRGWSAYTCRSSRPVPGDNVVSGETMRNEFLVGERRTGNGFEHVNLRELHAHKSVQQTVQVTPGDDRDLAMDAGSRADTWPMSIRMFRHGMEVASATGRKVMCMPRVHIRRKGALKELRPAA
jgi:hypothetical protein